MPRYEFTEGSSNKFWEIELSGSSFTTKHGKIGSTGQTVLKDWPDAATAKKEYDKLIAQKTKKGYELVGGGEVKATKAAAAKPVAAKVAKKSGKAPAAVGGPAFNPQLAKQIDADPDDAGVWSVYVDWLQGQGDPRGELGMVQEQLRKSPKDNKLVAAEKKLLREHAATIVGDFAKYLTREGKPDIPGVLTKRDLEPDYRQNSYELAPVRVQWRSGFFQQVFAAYKGMDWSPGVRGKKGDDEDADGDEGDEGFDFGKLLGDILSSPAARFMTSLRLGMPTDMEDGEAYYGELWKKLAKHEALTRLRSLYIGDITQEESECSWVDVGDISKLYPSLEKLRSLTIRGGGSIKLGKIHLPELRELTIITGGLDKKNIASICAAKWPKLESLELWLGTNSYGGNVTIKDLAPIFAGKAFPKLKNLGLCNSEIADQIAAALPAAPILTRLESLDLSKGTMSDTGAQAMIEHADAFAHLRKIDLSDNYIAKQSAAVAKICKAVRTRPQRTPDRWGDPPQEYRYTKLGE